MADDPCFELLYPLCLDCNCPTSPYRPELICPKCREARRTGPSVADLRRSHNQLVEALRSALGYMQHNARPDDAHWRDVVDEIEAALKAAEGEGT